MEIQYFDTLPSTQRYLLEALQNKSVEAPVAVLANEQSKGQGSRHNDWSGGEGNFFLSFALPLSLLPQDLPLHSASIYFSFIMKETLVKMGEALWLKWPNDFYKNDEKVGGTITKKVEDTLVCGIGINLKKSQNGYSSLQSDISPELLLEKYLESLEKFPKWKQVFSEYEIEFELSRKFSVHIGNNQNPHDKNLKKSLSNARLEEDGSVMIEGMKVYSLR